MYARNNASWEDFHVQLSKSLLKGLLMYVGNNASS